MAATKLLLLLALFLLSCLVFAAIGENPTESQSTRLTQAQQCRLQRVTATQPSQQIEHEAGVTELWDENDEQFQCAGVAAIRNTLQPNALSLPNFHPNPRLVYIERGQGLLGITFPGCPETYHSQSQPFQRPREGREQEQEQERPQGRRSDQHQKVHRIRQGDIVALPAGAAHWCFNDGNEELVAVSVNDLNHQANQLDQKLRAFYLAGGVPRRGGKQQGQKHSETFQNILRAFDRELMAEAYNVDADIVRRMQQEDERGFIVNAEEMRGIIRPEEEYEQEEQQEQERGQSDNGLEESFCTMKIRTNIDKRRGADVYSRQAGTLSLVDRNKLPILQYMDMSAEKGRLFPNAIVSPHWSMNGHSILYVTRGEAQIQVVDHNGRAVMNDRVNKGDMFVVPQYFTSTIRAERNGFEWVSMKTTSNPKKSPLVGYTSVMRAMPLQVLTNAYQISPREAQELKMNRGGQSLLLSPGGRRSD